MFLFFYYLVCLLSENGSSDYYKENSQIGGFECFFLFLFCFCLVCGEKVASAQDFVGNQRERTTLGRGFLFLVYLVTILYCSDIVWSKDLSGCFFCFLPILDWEFFFSLFFVVSEGKDWHSHPGSRFMISWDFGSMLVEWLVMIYARVWPVVRGYRGCPTLFPWYTCSNDD